MKGKELTASVSVIIDNNTIKPIEELTEAERQTMLENMRKRLSTSMSRYYSRNIQEYSAIT